MKHSSSNKRNRAGVTLAEIIIVLAISLSVIAVITLAYTAGIRSFQGEMSFSEAYLEGNQTLEKMIKEIRKARGVASAEAGKLSLWLEDLNSNYSMEAGEIISFSLANGNLTRASAADSQVLSGGVANISFSYDNPASPRLITIQLTLGSGEALSTLESKTKPRNIGNGS